MAVVKLANQPEVEPGEADGVRLDPHARNVAREHLLPGVQCQRTVRSVVLNDVPQPEERQQVEPAIHLRSRIGPLVAQRKVMITRSVFHCSHAEVVVLIAFSITQVLQQLRELPAQQHGVGRPTEVGRLNQVIRCQRLFALDPVGGVSSQRAYPVEQVPVTGIPVGMHDLRQQGKEGAVDIDAAQRVTEDRMVVLGIAPDAAERLKVAGHAGVTQVVGGHRKPRRGIRHLLGLHRQGSEHPKAAQKEQKTKVSLHGRKIWLPEGHVSGNKIVFFSDKPPAPAEFRRTRPNNGALHTPKRGWRAPHETENRQLAPHQKRDSRSRREAALPPQRKRTDGYARLMRSTAAATSA